MSAITGPYASSPPGTRHVPPLVDRRRPVLGRRRDDQLVVTIEARERGDQHGIDLRLAQGRERRVVVLGAGHLAGAEL